MAGYLTPNTPPADKWFVRRLFIPAKTDWLGLVDGAIHELTKAYNWTEHGDMSVQDTVDAFDVMYQKYVQNENEPPEWSDADDVDGSPAQPWYEALEDWIIAGFLAVTFTPAAAIVYNATVPKLRVAFRTGDIGALFRVLIDGVELWTGDSYDPITDILSQEFDLSAHSVPYEVRIEHNGIGGGGGTRAKLEVIRESVAQAMLATILRADPTGCGIQWSQDNGGSWETIDLSTCITDLADGAIDNAINDGRITGPGQPAPEQPPAQGTCQSFHVTLQGREQWLCPFMVQGDDTIVVTNATGGWADGGVSGVWACPNGDYYFASICGQPLPAVSGDPLMTANHMALIAKVGSGIYGNPITGIYTVPNGTSPSNLWLQANDSNIADNQGQIEFDVEICNNGGGYCWHIDFRLSDGGFSRVPGSNFGTWESGVGWKSDKDSYTHQVYIQLATSAFAWSAARMAGTNPHNYLYRVAVYNQTGLLGETGAPITADPWQAAFSFNSPATTLIKLSPFQSTGVPADYEFVLTDLWLYGPSANPFGANNC